MPAAWQVTAREPAVSIWMMDRDLPAPYFPVAYCAACGASMLPSVPAEEDDVCFCVECLDTVGDPEQNDPFVDLGGEGG